MAQDFNMQDFEIVKKENLLKEFSQYRSIIEKMTKE